MDDWGEEEWEKEISKHQVLLLLLLPTPPAQVLVLVHQVFLDLMTHSFFRLSSAALLILDECHHAQGTKSHPYSQIMRDWYHKLKEAGGKVPKVLGLSACLVVSIPAKCTGPPAVSR